MPQSYGFYTTFMFPYSITGYAKVMQVGYAKVMQNEFSHRHEVDLKSPQCGFDSHPGYIRCAYLVQRWLSPNAQGGEALLTVENDTAGKKRTSTLVIHLFWQQAVMLAPFWLLRACGRANS